MATQPMVTFANDGQSRIPDDFGLLGDIDTVIDPQIDADMQVGSIARFFRDNLLFGVIGESSPPTTQLWRIGIQLKGNVNPDLRGEIFGASSGWSSVFDRLLVELGRLKEGWEGEGSVAPSAKTLRDVEQALSVLPASTREPEVEVDSSDGSISFRWWSQDLSKSATLSFLGNGTAFIFAMNRNGATKPPAIVSVTDELGILDAIEDLQEFRALLVA